MRWTGRFCVALVAIPLALIVRVQEPKECISLAFGVWGPTRPFGRPESWWTLPPPLGLTERLAGLPGWYFEVPGIEWFEMRAGPPVPGADVDGWQVRELLAYWATAGDSIWLRSRSNLGPMLEIRAIANADTLIARAHFFTDLVDPANEPRANAYGIRSTCQGGDLAHARSLLARLVSQDTPDTLLGRQEAALEQVRWDSLLARALRNRIR